MKVEEIIAHINEDDKGFESLKNMVRHPYQYSDLDVLASIDKMINDDKQLLKKLREGVE